MDLALDTLPVETATVLATCAEAWVTADMIFDRVRLCRLDPEGEERPSVRPSVRPTRPSTDSPPVGRAATDRVMGIDPTADFLMIFVGIFTCV